MALPSHTEQTISNPLILAWVVPRPSILFIQELHSVWEVKWKTLNSNVHVFLKTFRLRENLLISNKIFWQDNGSMSLIFLAKTTTSKASLLKLACKYLLLNYRLKYNKLIRRNCLVFIYRKLFFSHCNYFYRIGFAVSKLLFFHVTWFVFLIVTRFWARFDDRRRVRTNGYHLWCSLSALNEMAIAIYETRHHYTR